MLKNCEIFSRVPLFSFNFRDVGFLEASRPEKQHKLREKVLSAYVQKNKEDKLLMLSPKFSSRDLETRESIFHRTVVKECRYFIFRPFFVAVAFHSRKVRRFEKGQTCVSLSVSHSLKGENRFSLADGTLTDGKRNTKNPTKKMS